MNTITTGDGVLRKATLKVYPGLPHGMCTTHKELINNDLLAFIQS